MKIINTKGILLNRFNYSESSIIVNILTEEYGKMSFIVNGARKPKAKVKSSYFQPLNIIDFEFIKSNKSDLHRIKEVSPNPNVQNIYFDVHKSAICMFQSELINSLHPYLEQNTHFFTFLENLVLYIDSAQVKELKNFNLWSVIKLMQFAGIYPQNNYSEGHLYFNPIEGIFTNNKYINGHIFSLEHSKLLASLLESNIDNNHKIAITKTDKKEMLDKLLEYIQIHFDGFKTGKSLDILMEVFE